jgi:hypothetical protein
MTRQITSVPSLQFGSTVPMGRAPHPSYFEGWDSTIASIVGLFNESLIDRVPPPYPPLFSQ